MVNVCETSAAKTTPRMSNLLLAAISDELWLPGDGVQRFHDTSPKGRRV